MVAAAQAVRGFAQQQVIPTVADDEHCVTLLEFLDEPLAFSADFIDELGVRRELLAQGH